MCSVNVFWGEEEHDPAESLGSSSWECVEGLPGSSSLGSCGHTECQAASSGPLVLGVPFAPVTSLAEAAFSAL